MEATAPVAPTLRARLKVKASDTRRRGKGRAVKAAAAAAAVVRVGRPWWELLRGGGDCRSNQVTQYVHAPRSEACFRIFLVRCYRKTANRERRVPGLMSRRWIEPRSSWSRGLRHSAFARNWENGGGSGRRPRVGVDRRFCSKWLLTSIMEFWEEE